MQERGFNIILEETASGFAARCAELPGCVVMGRSRYEAEEAMRTAIAFHLESLRGSGKLPPPNDPPLKLAA